MNLYNLYKQVILEETRKHLERISEGVSTNLVDTLLLGDKDKPGKHYRVEINYRNLKGELSNQFIEINQRNISTSGNNLIDARVLSKNGVEMPNDVYKKFRLDGIDSFKITKVAYYKPGEKSRTDGGNSSKNIASTEKWANYDYQYQQGAKNKIKTPDELQGVKNKETKLSADYQQQQQDLKQKRQGLQLQEPKQQVNQQPKQGLQLQEPEEDLDGLNNDEIKI